MRTSTRGDADGTDVALMDVICEHWLACSPPALSFGQFRVLLYIACRAEHEHRPLRHGELYQVPAAVSLGREQTEKNLRALVQTGAVLRQEVDGAVIYAPNLHWRPR